MVLLNVTIGRHGSLMGGVLHHQILVLLLNSGHAGIEEHGGRVRRHGDVEGLNARHGTRGNEWTRWHQANGTGTVVAWH